MRGLLYIVEQDSASEQLSDTSQVKMIMNTGSFLSGIGGTLIPNVRKYMTQISKSSRSRNSSSTLTDTLFRGKRRVYCGEL